MILTDDQSKAVQPWFKELEEHQEDVPLVEGDPDILEPYEFWPYAVREAREHLGTESVFAAINATVYADVRKWSRDDLEETTLVSQLRLGYMGDMREGQFPVFTTRAVTKDYIYVCPLEGPVDVSRAVRFVYFPLTSTGVRRRLGRSLYQGGEVKKRMSVSEFRKLGYLQELNRQFLHPLGLALEVVIEGGGSERFGGVWDYREDPEGVLYDEELMSDLSVNLLAERIEEKRQQRVQARVAAGCDDNGVQKLRG